MCCLAYTGCAGEDDVRALARHGVDCAVGESCVGFSLSRVFPGSIDMDSKSKNFVLWTNRCAVAFPAGLTCYRSHKNIVWRGSQSQV